MPETNQPLIVEISASQIADPETFEAERRVAYEATAKDRDPSARTGALTRLTQASEVVGGVALSDVVLEKLTSPADEAKAFADEAAEQLARVSDAVATTKAERRHNEATYRIEVKPDGTVQHVAKIVPVEADLRRTANTRRAMDQVPWGPKQNDTSFRVSRV